MNTSIAKLVSRAMLLTLPLLGGCLDHPLEAMQKTETVYFGGFARDQYIVDYPGYVPAHSNRAHPVAIVRPEPLPTAPTLTMKVRLSGFNGAPGTFCEGNDFAQPGYVVIKPCAGHLPHVYEHRYTGVWPLPEGQVLTPTDEHAMGSGIPIDSGTSAGFSVLGWWGWYADARGKNSNSMRIALALQEAFLNYGTSIDLLNGWWIEGTSYGGTGAINQAMLLRRVDSFWGKFLTVVRSDLAENLIAENEYQRNASIQVAWHGQNVNLVDFRKRAAKNRLDLIYWRINGSPADTSVTWSTEQASICNENQLMCVFTWGQQGHNLTEPGMRPDFFYHNFAHADQKVRLDKPSIAIHDFSANSSLDAPRGHYNLGIGWRNTPDLYSSPEEISVPLRYQRWADIGMGVPDQPHSVTFGVTVRLRDKKEFSLRRGDVVNWSMGEQSGQATVTRYGEITIHPQGGLSLYTGIDEILKIRKS
jgi:hypothetical protein